MHLDDLDEEIKYPFRLAPSNWIFSGLVVVGVLVGTGVDQGFTGYAMGFATATVLSMFILPVLIALLFWGSFGKKKGGGVKAFNVVLALMVLGKLASLSGDRQQPIQYVGDTQLETVDTSFAATPAFEMSGNSRIYITKYQ